MSGGATRGEPTAHELHHAAAAIIKGGIVAYPTDTLYGLAVDPRQESAVKRLCALKQRASGSGLPLIAGSLSQLESSLGAMPTLGRRLAVRFWPGPLTLVFVPRVKLVTEVHAGDGSLAVRVPSSKIARTLAEFVGHPVTATSANRSGERTPATGALVVEILGPELAAILGEQSSLEGDASTIVDVRGTTPTLIRAGAITWDHVLQSFG